MNKYEIKIECNETAADNLLEILKYFKMMGNLGGTRDFQIGNDCPKWFTFDGDGPDKIYSIGMIQSNRCGNEKHPNGIWHESTPLPASNQLLERIKQWLRKRRYGCPCEVKK